MDRIYTPSSLATQIAHASDIRNPQLVADFAVGDGALLRAARERWRDAMLFGSDIQRRAVQDLRESLDDCIVSTRDFLKGTRQHQIEKRLLARCDVILLNPPFSCRGRGRHPVTIAGREASGSKALTFVTRALPYLNANGQLIAILPASVLTSERDSELLATLKSNYLVTEIGGIRRAAFESHAVSVVILKFTNSPKKKPPSNKQNPLGSSLKDFDAVIRCGRLPVYMAAASKGGFRFVHTTDLREGKLREDVRLVSSNNATIRGPVVLIPRVGKPDKGKVVYLSKCEIVPSDCIISLHTRPRGYERKLAELLVSNWNYIEATFGGSCAPYTTLKRIQGVLRELGVENSNVTEAAHSIRSSPRYLRSNARKPLRQVEDSMNIGMAGDD